MNNEVAVVEPQKLSVELSHGAIAALAVQRKQITEFVKTQLKDGTDFGVIPGTPKPTLYKPGAEKLANIFMLGSRIVKSDTQINHESKFILCDFTVELYHLPTGRAVAQCHGSTNSLEKKFAKQDPYSLINTLQKMAQKRAFVGAVIQATNASDFFTQDLDDTDMSPNKFSVRPEAQTQATSTFVDNPIPEILLKKNPKFKGKSWRQAAAMDLMEYMELINNLIAYEEKKADHNYKEQNLARYRQAHEVGMKLGVQGEAANEDSIPF